MTPQLNSANIVILAQNHNPTIATKDWLDAKRVIPEEPINFMNVPVLSHYESTNFKLTVDESRWQVLAKSMNPDVIDKLPSIALTYVKALPETVYRAVGFNFEWRVKGAEKEDLTTEVTNMFVNPEHKLAELTQRLDCIVSGVIQFKHEGFRAQMTVVPNLEDRQELLLRFNYHRDVTRGDKGGCVAQIEETTSRFSATLGHSEGLVKEIIGG